VAEDGGGDVPLVVVLSVNDEDFQLGSFDQTSPND
jgi:hypothetical protein